MPGKGRQFKKGASGNPAGRPLAFRDHLRKLIGEHGEKAFDIVWEIAQGERTSTKWLAAEGGPVEVEAKPSIKEQLDAALGLAEHLVGKPVQSMEHAGEAGGAIKIAIQRNVKR